MVSGQWSVVSGTERLPVVSGTVSDFLRSALTGFLPSRRWRQWSLRILRKESSLAKDHENEDDPKFRGANDPPTTDNRKPTTSVRTTHRQLTTDHRQLRCERPADNRQLRCEHPTDTDTGTDNFPYAKRDQDRANPAVTDHFREIPQIHRRDVHCHAGGKHV